MDTQLLFRDVIVCVMSLLLLLGKCDGCYAFSTDFPDPCANKECEYGAQCVASLDGSSARCQVRLRHTMTSRTLSSRLDSHTVFRNVR